MTTYTRMSSESSTIDTPTWNGHELVNTWVSSGMMNVVGEIDPEYFPPKPSRKELLKRAALLAKRLAKYRKRKG